MEPIQFVFLLGAVIILFAAMMVVTRRNMVHAALFLILALCGVAMIFVLLEAYYWAVIQIVVYVGAISILVLMAVMVTRDVTGKHGEAFNQNAGWGAVLAVVVIATLTLALSFWPEFESLAPEAMIDNAVIEKLGIEFVAAEGYLLPTMTASILLLGAFLGALKLAFTAEQNKEDK